LKTRACRGFFYACLQRIIIDVMSITIHVYPTENPENKTIVELSSFGGGIGAGQKLLQVIKWLNNISPDVKKPPDR
jgi:hypothetical protein